MAMDDDTPVRSPAPPLSAEAEALSDIQLCCLELARDCGSAAARIDCLQALDRADLLTLWRRRLEAVTSELRALVERLPKA